MENSFPKLFIPGPTHVSKDILEELCTDQIGHRTPEISELIDFIVKGIKEILYTGEGKYKRNKNNIKKGILIPKNILRDIKELLK